jgi:hypothetical protein
MRAVVFASLFAMIGCTSQPVATTAPVPDIDHPVVAAAWAEPARAQWGDIVNVIVAADIAQGWHIYPLVVKSGDGIPTTLRSKAPAGTTWAGEWSTENDSGQELTGTVRFVRRLQVTPGWLGVVMIPIDFSYEACDPFSCRPPQSVPLFARLEVVR